MSEQARKIFNVKEQKAKDVLAAIQTVKPVISLIREWGKITKQYTQLKEDNAKLSEEIASIKKVIGLTCKGLSLGKDLVKILNKKSSEYEKSKKREEELKCIYDDMEKEVILYQEYANLFKWIDKDIIEKVLTLSNFEDKEEFLSMMFLLLNAHILVLYDLKPLRYYTDRFVPGANALLSGDGWNYMLKKLKANEL